VLVCLATFLCFKLPEMSQTLTPLTLLRETSHVLLCFNLPLWARWFRCPVATAWAKLRVKGGGVLWPYLVMASALTTPRDVTCPQILMLYNKEVWKPRGTISLTTCCRNRCRSASQILCSSEVSPRVEFINYLRAHCFSYHHSAPHKLNCVIFSLRTIINQHIIYPRSRVWKTWISILKCPARAWASIPLEPAARFHTGVPDPKHLTRDTTHCHLLHHKSCTAFAWNRSRAIAVSGRRLITLATAPLKNILFFLWRGGRIIV
jgi:hypothetical protein